MRNEMQTDPIKLSFLSNVLCDNKVIFDSRGLRDLCIDCQFFYLSEIGLSCESIQNQMVQNMTIRKSSYLTQAKGYSVSNCF